MTRYRRKSPEVDAERVDRDKMHRLSPEFRAAVCQDVCDGAPLYENGFAEPHVHVPVEPSPRPVGDGDFLVKAEDGGFYPCDPDVFAEEYEPVPS